MYDDTVNGLLNSSCPLSVSNDSSTETANSSSLNARHKFRPPRWTIFKHGMFQTCASGVVTITENYRKMLKTYRKLTLNLTLNPNPKLYKTRRITIIWVDLLTLLFTMAGRTRPQLLPICSIITPKQSGRSAQKSREDVSLFNHLSLSLSLSLSLPPSLPLSLPLRGSQFYWS